MPAEEVTLSAAIYTSVVFCAGLGCLIHFLFVNATPKRLAKLDAKIGGWPLIAILVAEVLLGAWLMRREGSRAWRALNAAFSVPSSR